MLNNLSILRHTMFSEQLPRLSNTIRFQDSYSKEWCEIKIDVNQHKSGFYELTYTASMPVGCRAPEGWRGVKDWVCFNS